ncbi:MAG: ATP-binding protein, partial [Anaerolineales bacterium]|nr:ATP-binding protein [Anaerolineales bacterium]
TKREIDYVRSAQQEGASIIQSFHSKITKRGGHLFSVISDVCAMANTNGGVIFIGTTNDPASPHTGVTNISRTITTLKGELSRRITPTLNCSVDSLTSRGKKVLRINVPRGDDPPYAIDDNKIFVRDEAETTAAVRDEIVQLTHLARKRSKTHSELLTTDPEKKSKSRKIGPPRTGVEIVATEERDGTIYHTMRDLRNGNQVKNVTRASSRRLWHYAIMQKENDISMKDLTVKWQGNLGFIKHYRKGPITRTDLCQRVKEGHIRIYYGVTEDGLHGPWRKLANTSK